MTLIRSTCIVIAVIASTIVFSGGAAAQTSSWTLDSAFQALAAYSEGADRAPLDYLEREALAAASTFTLKRDLEARFLAIIQRTDISAAARSFALDQLQFVATDQSVIALEPLLYDAATSEMARVAIERVPTNSATDALVKAMQKTRGATQAGIIYSLGARRDPRSAEAIAKFSGKGDSEVVRAAIWALGEIGGPVAEDDLRWARSGTLREHRDFAAMSLVRVADRYMEQGDTKSAIALYDLMFIKAEPEEVRARALQGLLHADPEIAVETILDVLRSDTPEVQQAALRAVRDLPGDAITKQCAAALPNLPADSQAKLAIALGERGDPTALPAIHNLLYSDNAVVRHAAIQALSTLGDHTSVSALLALLIRPGVDDTEQIRPALVAMDGPGVDDELVEEVYGPNPRVRTEIIKALVARGTPNATAALIRVAETGTGPVQLEALEGLSQVASIDAVPVLVNFMVSASTAEARAAAHRAIVTTLQRTSGSDDAGALVAALSRKDVPIGVKSDLVELIAISGDESALPALAEFASRDKTELGLACIETLGAWPSNAALEPLTSLAGSFKRDPQRAAWVAALTRQASRPQGGATLHHFELIADAAETGAEKTALLEAVRTWGSPEGTAITKRLLEDPEVGALAAEIQQDLGG